MPDLRALLADAHGLGELPWDFLEPRTIVDAHGDAVAEVDGLFTSRHRNAALIVAAVNTLPALLDVVEAARLSLDFLAAAEPKADVLTARSLLRSALDRLEATDGR